MAMRTKRGTAGINVKTTGSEHNSQKEKKNTMTMNNEARQDNIIYINECLMVGGF